MPFIYTGSQQNAGGLIVHNNTFDSTPGTANDAIIFAAGGDWVYEATETNHAATVASNWFCTYEYFANSNYDFVTHSYNTATHATSEIATMGFSSLGASISGAGQQLCQNRFCFGVRDGAPSYPGYGYLGEWNADLDDHQNTSTRFTEGQYYNGGYRLSDTMAFNYAASNYAGFYMHSYTGGADTGANALTSPKAAGSSNVVAGGAASFDFSSPGGGVRDSNAPSSYANLGDYADLIFATDGTANYFGESTTRVDLSILNYNHVGAGESSTPTEYSNDNAITLPSHSGSTQGPNIFATTWGNIVFHHDTANPSNARVYPVTWGGAGNKTASVGTHKSWIGGDIIPSHECLWRGIDGIGAQSSGHGYKYMCGSDRGTQRPDDFYRTFRMRDIGSDMALDILVVDFTNSDGTHSVTILHKDAKIYSSSDSAVIHPIFMANNKDVLIWHKDTNSLDYFENAFAF